MSAASDRARFQLEQQVPQLQEFERKGIFTREEVRSIAAKRSAFEHAVNATGPKPTDYARYIAYEINLDTLRKKRSKRLGVKNTSAFNGQRTILRLLDRATKKFPGDTALWMQYIQFCQHQKAHKKLEKVFTQALRLRPREYGVWVLAAKFYAEDRGDMSAARSYMQRGLRFCKDEQKLWLEFVRLEMAYLAKIAERGSDDISGEHITESGQNDDGEDMIMLPTVVDDTPALKGAIVITIFDAAMKQFETDNQAGIAQAVFDLVASFGDNVPATDRILRHILRNSDAAAAVASSIDMR